VSVLSHILDMQTLEQITVCTDKKWTHRISSVKFFSALNQRLPAIDVTRRCVALNNK